jgi:predicted transglutaminase-like cysteine proteinase
MRRIVLAALGLLVSACAATESAPAPEPFGVADYCTFAQHRADQRDKPFRDAFCNRAEERATVKLTAERWRDVKEVQALANASILYRPTASWDPLATEGDCKTFVARKELELLNRGWPSAALRIAMGFVDDGRYRYEYHAVLLVDTDRGTLVLDNRTDDLVAWNDARYIWVVAQAPARRDWVRFPVSASKIALALSTHPQLSVLP